MKFEGYVNGVPWYSDPDCPPDTLYLMPRKKKVVEPKVEVSPSYSQSYSPSMECDCDHCYYCSEDDCILDRQVNVHLDSKTAFKIDWIVAGFQLSAGVFGFVTVVYWLIKLLDYLF